MDILTLTMNPSIDSSTTVDKVQPDKKLRGSRPEHEPGGGGINVARAVRKLGGEALAVYCAGGPTGDQFEGLLDEEGVPQLRLKTEGLTRTNTTVTERSSDRQFRFVVPGPELQETEWRSCLDAVKSQKRRPRWVVASGSLPPGAPDDFYARLAEVCFELDARLLVDTSGEPLRQAVRQGVYLIKPNMREMQDLIGEEAADEQRLKAAAGEMLEECRCRVIVVSLGAGGALLISGEGTRHIRTPTVPIRSRVGAGDSMMAGLVLALSRGESLPRATMFGVAAGASAVMTPGSELCRRDDTERLFDRMIAESEEGSEVTAQ